MKKYSSTRSGGKKKTKADLLEGAPAAARGQSPKPPSGYRQAKPAAAAAGLAVYPKQEHGTAARLAMATHGSDVPDKPAGQPAKKINSKTILYNSPPPLCIFPLLLCFAFVRSFVRLPAVVLSLRPLPRIIAQAG